MSLKPPTYAAALKQSRKKPEKRKPIKRTGRLTAAWAAARAKLKPAFEAAGITTCELRLAGCWNDNGLGFAHSKPRRDIKGAEIYEVIVCCPPCHQDLDGHGHAHMSDTVLGIIADRPTAVTLP